MIQQLPQILPPDRNLKKEEIGAFGKNFQGAPRGGVVAWDTLQLAEKVGDVERLSRKGEDLQRCPGNDKVLLEEDWFCFLVDLSAGEK